MTAIDILLAAGLAGLLVFLAEAWRVRRSQRRAIEALARRRLGRPTTPLATEDLRDEGWLGNLLHRARLEPRVAALAAGGTLAVSFAAGVAAGGLAPLVAPVASLATLAVLLRWRIERNALALSRRLPVFVDGVRQHLLVGASLPQAIQRAVEAGDPILRWAFEAVPRRLSAGAELVETLQWTARRQGGEALANLVAAIAASSRFGGQLTDALSRLAEVERRKERVREEMRAATAEVRASALILAVLPLAVGGWLLAAVPTFAEYFTDPDQGRPLLAAVAILYGAGLLLLREIARPRY